MRALQRRTAPGNASPGLPLQQLCRVLQWAREGVGCKGNKNSKQACTQ